MNGNDKSVRMARNKETLFGKFKNRNNYFIWIKCDNCGMDNKASIPKGVKITPGVTTVCDNCGVTIKIEEYTTEWIH